MNHCAIQQNAFSNREENRNSVSIPISERRNPVACPIPRRLGLLSDHPSRSLRFQFSHQSELCDSIAGTDFLEIILTKGYGMDNQSFCKQVSSSQPRLPSKYVVEKIKEAKTDHSGT
ncbi:hypothetical protein OIU78_006953 [Salix suchowensis]|nr:hypothetical protein OIU78_006953 [Salix suchowensis]